MPSVFTDFAQYINKLSPHTLYIKMIMPAVLMISLAILIIAYLMKIEERDTLIGKYKNEKINCFSWRIATSLP
ncbi:hypothetical protein BB987_12175 [Photorhabdus temperata]|nr:hypothetical protein BB987_12175 [Photorhabdus temperata]